MRDLFWQTCRPSKRASTIADDDGCSKLVTTETQTFLAKKLSEHLDRYYIMLGYCSIGKGSSTITFIHARMRTRTHCSFPVHDVPFVCFIYSVYKLVSPSHTACEGTFESETCLSNSTKTNTPAVKLFHNSIQPVKLDEQYSTMMRKHLTENESKPGQYYGRKRKRKNPPRCVQKDCLLLLKNNTNSR